MLRNKSWLRLQRNCPSSLELSLEVKLLLTLTLESTLFVQHFSYIVIVGGA